MDTVDFRAIVEAARKMIIAGADDGLIVDIEALHNIKHENTYANGVRDMVAALLFPDVPEAVAIELANTALKSPNW